MLSRFAAKGFRDVLQKYAGKQPSLSSANVVLPLKAQGVKSPAVRPIGTPPAMPELGKEAAQVGMGASTEMSSSGAGRGEPADTGRRQRSVIDRAFQANDNNFMTSSMPEPGFKVSP